MQHVLKENFGLLVCKQQSTYDFQHVFITKCLTDHNSISLQTKEASFVFPLYLYPDTQTTDLFTQPTRQPNLNMDIVQQIAAKLGLSFVPEREGEDGGTTFTNPQRISKRENQPSFAPIDLLDYIYAVLHSPSYRERYKEFLKIDFPRVPYPTDAGKFWQLVRLGGELRQLQRHPGHQRAAIRARAFATTASASGTMACRLSTSAAIRAS